MLQSSVAGLLVFGSIALASPRYVVRNESSPCAQVSASVASQKPAATPTVPAQLAYDCISSVPFNKSAAVELVNSVKPYIRWQSNTVWLKDPPEEYEEKVQEGTDIWAELEEIQAKVESGAYENEFEVCQIRAPQLSCHSRARLTYRSLDGKFIGFRRGRMTVILYSSRT